ncbi:hypothetical protein PENTCL1PPCAC_8638, partial [Pristionchus entomophagus]
KAKDAEELFDGQRIKQIEQSCSNVETDLKNENFEQGDINLKLSDHRYTLWNMQISLKCEELFILMENKECPQEYIDKTSVRLP